MANFAPSSAPMFAIASRPASPMRVASGPAYSIAAYWATSVPKRPARCSTTSLDMSGRSRLAPQVEADGRGHLEPQLAQGQHVGHLGGADPRSRRADRAVGGRVRVGTEHQLPRLDVAALDHHLVADALVAEVVADLVLLDEAAHDRVGAGVGLGGRREEVVEDHVDPVGVGQPFDAQPSQGDAAGGERLVAHEHVRPGGHVLPRHDAVPPAGAGQDLLGHRHAHGTRR